MSLFAHYYQTELAYYRDLVQEFARRYPEVAHMVLEGADPAVERLLQGAALLTSRLRLRVEDDFPEIIGTLFEQMWPAYVRPTPAATLMQYVLRGGSILRTLTLPTGTGANGHPVADEQGKAVECTFRTTAPVQLHPMEVVDATLDPAHPADWLLRISFRMNGSAIFDNAGIKAIRLHFLGDDATRYGLYVWICRHAHRVSVRTPNDDICLSLAREAIHAAGLTAEDALGSTTRPPFHTAQLLEEYFSFPEQFLAVDVLGLDRVPRGRISDTFQIVFHLGQPTGRAGQAADIDLDVAAANVALGCVPAINVSEKTQIDISVTRNSHTYVLAVPTGSEVFELFGVRGYDKRSRTWIAYQDYSGGQFRYLDYRRPCYLLLRRADGVKGNYAQLVITNADGMPLVPPTDQLRVLLSCTNGSLPSRLGVGQVSRRSASSPDFTIFRNVAPVVPQRQLVLGNERHWRLLAMLCMSPNDLASVNGLTQIIQYARRNGVSSDREPQLLKVESRVSGRLHRQAVVPMRQVTIELAQDSFRHEGELFLFANVLNQLYRPSPTSDTRCEVTVRAMPSKIEYRFPPM